MTAAVVTTRGTQDFMDRFMEMADEAGADVEVRDAAEAGWMMPHGEAIEVLIYEADGLHVDEKRFLVTVREVK